MSDNDVITRITALHENIRPPATDVEADVQRGRRVVRRRRTLAGGAAAAAVVGVLALIPLTTGSSNSLEQLGELRPPTSAPTSAPSGSWSLERIRSEGIRTDVITARGPDLSVRLYVVQDGPAEPGAPLYSTVHAALEVTQDQRSALFDYRYSSSNPPWVAPFGGEGVLVQDAHSVPPGDAPEVRYRLLQADGAAVELRLSEQPAPAVPGPGVVQIDAFSTWSTGGVGAEELYLVDPRARTLRPLKSPPEVRYWGPNLGNFLWGVTSDCRVYWAVAGTFRERRLGCAEGKVFTALNDQWFPQGWLEPGRMALVEVHLTEADTPASPVFLHVSLDKGDTWQRIAVKDDAAITDELRHLVK